MNKRRLWIVSFACLGMVGGCSASPENTEHSEQSASGEGAEEAGPPVGKRESPIGEEYTSLPAEEQVQKVALSFQRKGYVDGNLNEYINHWAEEGELLELRSEGDKKQVHRFDGNQLESSRRILFSEGGALLKDLIHEEAKATVDGDEATLRVKATHVQSETTSMVYQEVYDFRKADRGWELIKLRRWPLLQKEAGDEVRFDRQFFTQADNAVALAQEGQDDDALRKALVHARRFGEAYIQYRKLFESGQTISGADWLAGADISVRAGHISSAMEYYDKAKAADPSLKMPAGGLILREIRANANDPEAGKPVDKIDVNPPPHPAELERKDGVQQELQRKDGNLGVPSGSLEAGPPIPPQPERKENGESNPASTSPDGNGGVLPEAPPVGPDNGSDKAEKKEMKKKLIMGGTMGGF